MLEPGEPSNGILANTAVASDFHPFGPACRARTPRALRPCRHSDRERPQLRDTAHRVSALARREFCFADSDVERTGRLAKCSIAASLRRAVLLVDPFAAPCRAQRQRPFRARSTLGIVAVADHDHLRRVASAFSHSSHVFILLPVQAFSALSVEWSGYEGFHRGFSLGAQRVKR